MKGHIRQCPCDQTYTLLKICPICGSETIDSHPARYSPQDHYGKYRRRMKEWNR